MLPTLNIVLYTDYPTWFHETPLDPEGGLTDLEAFIREKTKHQVNVKFKLISRHGADPGNGVELHGENLITEQLLCDADELWIFGRRIQITHGSPHNELEDSEIKILEKYIRGDRRIGILVTGDHAQSPEGLACHQSTHETYMSLGRALGKRIPIAGLLRDWDGPPTNCVELPLQDRDNFNTQEGVPPATLDESDHESDSIPQTIILDPAAPHPLFTYVDSSGELRLIEKLPDHNHEGRVLGPEDLAGDWPKDMPEPVVAARGRDNRFANERISNLVVAFDGDQVAMSRMVVDSSFHHFLDYNLKNIPARNPVSRLPEPGSQLDQIAHFFGNLALWLAPKPIRDKIKLDIMLSLTRHTSVLEALSLSDDRLGRVTRHVLKTTIGSGRLQWLESSSLNAKSAVDDIFSLFFLSEEKNFPFNRIITADAFLGFMVRVTDHVLTECRIADVTRLIKADWLRLWSSLLMAMEVAVAEPSNNNLKGEEEDMAQRCNHHWRSFVNENRDGVLKVHTMTGAHFEGKHDKGGGNEVDFEGDCEDQPQHHIHIETKENFEYNGRIFEAGNDMFAVGTRNKFAIDRDGKRKKITQDELWVGVKVGD